MTQLKYHLKTFWDAGLEARRVTSRRGRSKITVRDKSVSQLWLVVEPAMFEEMKIKGVRDTYFSHAVFLDMFHITED